MGGRVMMRTDDEVNVNGQELYIMRILGVASLSVWIASGGRWFAVDRFVQVDFRDEEREVRR